MSAYELRGRAAYGTEYPAAIDVYCVIAGVASLIWASVGQSRGWRAIVFASRPVSTHPPM